MLFRSAPAPVHGHTLGSRASVDTSVHCGQWDTVTAGSYSLLLDLWGESGATSGSQCANLVSLDGSTVAWSTNWTWVGSSGVKSFSNVQLNEGINTQLSAIENMPVRMKRLHEEDEMVDTDYYMLADRLYWNPLQTTWTWSYDLSGCYVLDVAYDLFTSSTAGGSGENEIMVWLANYNAGPIASSYDASGQPVPNESNISLAGKSW